MVKKASWLSLILGVSRSILHDRVERRRFIIWVIVAMLGMVALGNWPLEGWLEDRPLGFIFWWGACALLALLTFLLGLYDALAVLRENRRR
jgi:hypothetical protein